MRNVASFLRLMRKKAGLTQNEASDGIVDKDTLSLYERGRQNPHPENFMMLLERYGVTGYSCGDFFDQSTARLMDLKNKILSAMNFLELGQLPELLSLYKEECEIYFEKECENRNIFERQFYRYVLAWYCYIRTGDRCEFLRECLESIALTQPGFRMGGTVGKAYLIQNELMIINTIAILYAMEGKRREALCLFEQMLIEQNKAQCSHPIQNRNLACLCHNAALLEWEIDPMISTMHLGQSMRYLSQYGGMWTGCMVWRSQLQITRKLEPARDLTRDCWELEAAYRKFRPVSMKDMDFSTFIEQQDFLFLL